jgi:hypothetical protein
VNATVEVIVRTPEQAEKHECGTLVNLGGRNSLEALEPNSGSDARELVARMLIDWAADYADLEVGEVRSR